MNAIPAGLVLEVIVCVLLASTIGYCAMIDRRLKAMRKGQDGLLKIVRQLNGATDQAISAIGRLKHASDATGQELMNRVAEARALADGLSMMLTSGANIADRLSERGGPRGAAPLHVPVSAPRLAPQPSTPREHKPALQAQLLERLQRAGNGAKK